MINWISRVLKDCLTVANGEDYCHSKCLSFLGFMVYLIISIYMLWKSVDKFSLSECAIGMTTIIGGGAASAAIKKDTEPN